MEIWGTNRGQPEVSEPGGSNPNTYIFCVPNGSQESGTETTIRSRRETNKTTGSDLQKNPESNKGDHFFASLWETKHTGKTYSV